MAQDIMGKFYTILNLPLYEKLMELTKIIDQSSPNKELQAFFPQLISNVFGSGGMFNTGWGLRTFTYDNNRQEFMLLSGFLEPQGPMFRLCYKLLADPQLKYNIPINILPHELQVTLEKGRCSQFYADLIALDSQGMNVVALALNPFDYYIFHFALYLVSSSLNKSSWENWNSVYFALACDYLVHFLPTDPNIPVLPHIPNYTGKVLVAAPLQTANRPLCSSSLLLIPDISGLNNQHATQTQSRHEVWRSETILQVFIDIWMSVDEFDPRNIEIYQRSYPVVASSPERVRTVRVLVKHIHGYSAKHVSDPAIRSSTLRKYARQILCTRAYHYVKYLVTTWPLDASFRLVMELWLSLIQPWRYTDDNINRDRFTGGNNNQEEGGTGMFDASYTQFIAENFPSYTCIFQLVMPRFMRLDLTTYKNAVMLFRLGKVFSQHHLVTILRDLEVAITENNSGIYFNQDTSWHNTSIDRSLSNNSGMSPNKWVAVAKQAITEMNLSADFQYTPIWSENRKTVPMEFVQKIMVAKAAAEKIVEEHNRKMNQQNQGFWSALKHWLMITGSVEEEMLIEEAKKVPTYLGATIDHFSHIFGLSERNLVPPESLWNDNDLEHSSFANSSSFPTTVTSKLRSITTSIQYMGDPDLMPITSYESTILVRFLYQISSRLNEMYEDDFARLWHRNDFWGHVAREVLQEPITIRTYMKDSYNHQNIVSQNLPPRLSLRRYGSYSCVVWTSLGYVLFRLLSYSGWFYVFFLIINWMAWIFAKACIKTIRFMST